MKTASDTWAALSELKERIFYMHNPTDRIGHTTTFVTRNTSMGPP